MEDNKQNITEPSTSSTSKEESLFKVKTYFSKFWKDALNIEEGVDKRATINEIKNKNSMSGANAWMLMCSIVIASVGLDMNSPAVIIGAMLISPLMSPILGIGLAVGINDKETLKKSLSHFGMAVFIAVMTSTIYFWLTPLGDMTPQIEARTEPGPLDIFIAFFGGIAGIVSIARKDISTTLPGVAIATALMPPLCVTGYGIANMGSGEWSVALSSFFLFFINTVFVSFATYLVVRILLKFPFKDFVDEKEKRKNTMYITGFLFAIAFISYFPFSNILHKRDMEQRVDQFIDQYISEDELYLDNYDFSEGKESNLLVLKVYGDSISNENIDYYRGGLEKVGLENTEVKIISTSEINMDDLDYLDKKIGKVQNLANKIEVVEREKKESDEAIEFLRKELQSFRIDSSRFNRICSELRTLHPEIKEITYAKGQSSLENKGAKNTMLVVVEWKENPRDFKNKKITLNDFLKIRLEVDDLKVVHMDFE